MWLQRLGDTEEWMNGPIYLAKKLMGNISIDIEEKILKFHPVTEF